MAAFYVPVGDGRYRSTEHTVGPWDRRSQHGGPPAALLARAMEAESPSWPATFVRVTVDILGPVPAAEVTVRSRVLRPGRSVELVEAELDAGDRPAMRAQAWRVRETELALPPLPESHDDPAAAPVPDFPDTESPWWPGSTGGYLDAMEWRFAGGKPFAPGPATIWGRMRFPLVPDEEPTGLQRMLILADSGNGASSVLPWTDWRFINPELTVHVAAVPMGEWICLDARTRVDRRGFGLATSRLFDRARLVGRGAQALYVGPQR
jgi:Acyl-CoA thioesterase C-terminal domain/Acyl-CoA thioesterase N-terminal domain